jgi:hypothetical protein
LPASSRTPPSSRAEGATAETVPCVAGPEGSGVDGVARVGGRAGNSVTRAS